MLHTKPNHTRTSTTVILSASDVANKTASLVKSDPLAVAIPLTVLYASILITGVIGNVITCVVILKNKYLHTTTNYYLFSLAISDLLLLTFGLPQEMYYIWSRYPYIFGETFCFLRGFMAETSTNASVLTITAFTVERYIAICHPFYAHAIATLSRVIKIVLAIWIVAFLFAIPQAMQFGLFGDPEFLVCSFKRELIPYSFEFSTLVFFIIPMIAIVILYLRIGTKLKKSANLKQRRVSVPMLSTTTQHNSSRSLLANGQSSRKVLKMLVAVVITFFVCWAPFHIQRLVAMRLNVDDKIYDIVTYISAISYYMSTTINPILYHTMSHKFRDAFKETAGALFGKGELSNESTSKFQNTRKLSQDVPNVNKFKVISNEKKTDVCDATRKKSINNGDDRV